MEILTHGSFGPEPLRLGLPDWWPELNLDELGSTCHLLIRFYMPDWRFARLRQTEGLRAARVYSTIDSNSPVRFSRRTRAASTKARKIARDGSSSSTDRSGCHCTASTK